MTKFGNRTACFGALLCATLLSTNASAQDTGSIIKRYDRAKIDPRDQNLDSQDLIYAYGACVVKARPRSANAFVETFPFSRNAERLARSLALNECLQGNIGYAELEFQGEALRGPVFKALYRLNFASVARDVLNAPKVDYAAGAPNKQDEDTEALLQLREFADCAVRNDPVAARALVMADVQSGAEAAAFQQFTRPMGGCVKVGDSIKLTKPLVRALTAEALYRLSLVATATTAASGKRAD